MEDAGLTWIGPPSAAIELMGSKTAARQAMRAAGVPIIPGTTEPVSDPAEIARLADEVGYPLILKPRTGAGALWLRTGRAGTSVVPGRGAGTAPTAATLHSEAAVVRPRMWPRAC